MECWTWILSHAATRQAPQSRAGVQHAKTHPVCKQVRLPRLSVEESLHELVLLYDSILQPGVYSFPDCADLHTAEFEQPLSFEDRTRRRSRLVKAAPHLV